MAILIDHYMNQYNHTLIYNMLTEEQTAILTAAPVYSNDL